eukprot:Gb_37651 [translate_table: standard]
MHRSKIEKIKCIFKKWKNYGKVGKSYSSLSSNPTTEELRDISYSLGDTSPVHEENEVPEGYQVVYVGKSMRRYVVSTDHLNHPLLRVLIEKSEGNCGTHGGQKAGYVISCEVVFFEHLLWMLKNADPEMIQSDSLDELVDFYTC